MDSFGKRLFISLTPGKTFLDKLQGKTKIRLFFAFILILVATWDMRILFPTLIISIIGLVSIKPDWKTVRGLTVFTLLMNLFNLFLIWVIEPNYGYSQVGATTVLIRFTETYIISAETLWYFLVRLTKFMATFFVSLTFIQCITPSEMAAGLYGIGIPYKISTVVSLAFRYIPEIARDFNEIKISMQARGLELDSRKASVITRLKQNVLILVPLIIVSFDRVGNIADAMDLRGYGRMKTRTYYAEHEPTKGDRIVNIANILLYAGFIAIVVVRIISHREFLIWAPWVK
ncbi:MAG: energy-coupling factor transporter transmembrane protein EcfT [Erysipelotrichaceae bacterium]|nr:energy-coupling factor transporter transmembrane protein EcfT [Erysipelotrichaceae bacterium]